MNVLKCYITKVIYEIPYNFKEHCKNQEVFEKYKDDEFLEVCFDYDCYGVVSNGTGIYQKSKWEKIKERGYFFG